MKALAFMLLLSLLIAGGACLYYKQDIIDFQAYIKKDLQPNLRGYGQDLAE